MRLPQQTNSGDPGSSVPYPADLSGRLHRLEIEVKRLAELIGPPKREFYVNGIDLNSSGETK